MANVLQKNLSSLVVCPCGGGKPGAKFNDCCEPFLLGTQTPANAEALMRSRYSAYALNQTAYVLATWHPSTRPQQLDLSQQHGRWLGLRVIGHWPNGNAAKVEFEARFKPEGGGAAQRMNERSRFVLEEGRWWYVDGDF